MHLVEQKQDALVVAELAHGFEIRPVGRADAAFSLHRLEHYSRSVVGDCRKQCVEITEGGLVEACVTHYEAIAMCGIEGGGDSAERAAMKRAAQRNYPIAVGLTLGEEIATNGFI